jgi:hypothetical protein
VTGDVRFGDRCVYFPGDDAEVLDKMDERYDAPAKLWRAVRAAGGLVVPHHSGYAREGLMWGTDWDYHDDDAQPVVEIYSKHGASEFAGNPRPLGRMGAEGCVQSALARGHRLGFVGGSDTHVSRPGSDILEDYNDVLLYSQAGLTAVRAAELTRAGLLSGLRARACYATTGERIWLDFRVGGVAMGGEVEPADGVEIAVEAHGTEPIALVEIVRNGDVVFSAEPKALSAELGWTDEATGPAYYYARVTQVNGSRAWASPVWVSRR